jgi:hypothetical protein
MELLDPVFGRVEILRGPPGAYLLGLGSDDGNKRVSN